MEQGLVGRQPIYKDGVDVFAYEFFSRNHELKQAAFANGDTVTAEALLHECLDVGLGRLAGARPAFVDVTREFILNEYSWFLPREGVVLQVAGGADPDDALLRAATRLKRAGYSIALKDCGYRDAVQPLAELADFVKINVRSGDRLLLEKRLDKLRPLNVKVLAQGVETPEDYEAARALGADCFEGYFFCKPKPAAGEPLPHNRLSTLQLLSTIQNPDATLEELERALGQDVAMSYRILRYVNTPMNPSPRNVESIRHAISLVGTNLIRQWAGVIWLESIEEKPRELMVMSAIRAHMCRQLGVALGCGNPEQFFTAGLLSLLDALIDRSMDVILRDLPLVEPVKEALLNRSGAMGDALKCIEACERCEWAKTSLGNLAESTIREAYLTGVIWTRGMLNELAN